MFLLIYYIRVGYGAGDASPDPAPNPYGFLKHPPPPPHYNSGSGKICPIGGGADRIPTGRIQIAIPIQHGIRARLSFYLLPFLGAIYKPRQTSHYEPIFKNELDPWAPIDLALMLVANEMLYSQRLILAKLWWFWNVCEGNVYQLFPS